MAEIDTPMTTPQQRRRWLAVLARATTDELEAAQREHGQAEPVSVRATEIGTAMLRGRIGGDGQAFNLGEATLARCAVRVGAYLGVGYTLGRDRRKAELIALFDALLQDPAQHERLERTVVAPLAARQEQTRRAQSAVAATSRVEFFTLVRGEA
jgi:alpha-D-ribose 1-methylphosphonate 5-triphosphate synthase subunit PhnG